MGEFVGMRLTVTEAPGVRPLPFCGLVMDETLNLFYVRPDGATRARALPKAGLVGTLSTGGREIPLRGDDLRVRPEDRIKRLAPRGRRARR
jgi:RNase P/RNase MRP subunit p29